MSDEDLIAYLGGDDRDLDPADRAELDELRALLADPSLWADPADDLEDRVAAAIGAAQLAAPATPPTAPPDASPTRPAGARRPRTWRVLAVAAALLIAVGVVATFVRNDTSGEHFSLALAAPSGAGAADGRADFLKTSSGWRVKLNASSLPRLDGGRFYEAWMRNPDGTLVPIGTFNEGKSVVLWAGVSPHDFPTLTITEEAADGNQASSGKRVLAGTLTFGG